MSWVRIDDQAWDHPKHVAAGPMAFALWTWGLLYCSRHTTDGLIPADAPLRCGVPKAEREITRLVVAGLWEEVESGYRIHDYHDYNPSKSQVLKRKEAASRRLADWRKSKRYAHGNVNETPLQDDFGSVVNTAPVPVPVPDPDPIPKKTKYNGEVGFAEFWSAYPRKVAKPAAYRAWNKIAPDETVRAIILASVASWSKCHDWRKAKGMFVPHPATWLNERRWEDTLPKDDTATEAFIAEYADEYAAVRGGSYVATDADFVAASELLSVYGCRAKSIATKFIASKSERLDRVPERTIAQLLRHAPAIDAFMRGINHE